MKAFVLIYWLLTPSGASVATATAEFFSRETCEYTWSGIVLSAGDRISVRSGHLCIQK